MTLISFFSAVSLTPKWAFIQGLKTLDRFLQNEPYSDFLLELWAMSGIQPAHSSELIQSGVPKNTCQIGGYFLMINYCLVTQKLSP